MNQAETIDDLRVRLDKSQKLHGSMNDAAEFLTKRVDELEKMVKYLNAQLSNANENVRLQQATVQNHVQQYRETESQMIEEIQTSHKQIRELKNDNQVLKTELTQLRGE